LSTSAICYYKRKKNLKNIKIQLKEEKNVRAKRRKLLYEEGNLATNGVCLVILLGLLFGLYWLNWHYF